MLNVSKLIANEFGSKLGLLRYVLFGFKTGFGNYRRAIRINHANVNRLVFICSGNICRSPFGEVVSQQMNFPAISYGLHCRGDDPAFEKTIRVADKLGYDLTHHRSQNIKDYKPHDGDLLIVMEPAHLLELESILPDCKKVLIGMLSDQKTVYLHDPYNTNEYFFEKCLKAIEVATQRLIKEIGNKK
ncbi:arsenate-mycothiol transferase ArsC [Alteromonas sp. ASW11-130]|uniref:arsenate-mycothiol transferase ArsC n=1 Tax=Alteromonas sp. ASW11-130 TaxID=3015775 RepID=UPI002242572C|nr:hypothetical protein [Alteromonas sp. ASW11-130]MCW8091292.1 hypothetical protein [Alteromonas sp. ASW11-130]